MSDDFYRCPIEPTGAMNATDSITSQPFILHKYAGISFQPKWDGTPTGVFSVWVSNDYGSSPALKNSASPMSVGTWSELPASISGNPSGSASNTFIPVFASCAYWVILKYTNVSGSGVLSGYVSGKYRG